MKLQSVDVKTLSPEVFRVFGTQNALLTAGDRVKCNTMTIGWCQLGCVWNLPTCTVYVRPERYTYQFMESHDYFTVSVFPADRKKDMAFCGTKSGRDVDKVKECGFTVAGAACGAPYFEEAGLVLVCKKAYWQDMDPTHFLDGELDGKWYPERDYHRIFIGEIVEVLKKN